MNLDRLFITKLIDCDTSDYSEVSKVIKDSMLFGADKKAFRFIKDHFIKYSSLPSKETVEVECVISFEEEAVEPIDYYVDNIKSRHLYNTMGDGTKEVIGLLEKQKPEEAFKVLEKFSQKIRSDEILENRVTSIISLGEKIVEQYEKHKDGMITGVKSPYPTLDNYTLGWQDEDMVVVAARPQTGKTWLLTVMAEYAWRQGQKVFFVSPEISDIKLAQRFISLNLKLPYMDLRRGRLGSFLEPTFYSGVKELVKNDDKRFMTLSSSFGIDINSIRSGIIEFKPDIVFLDGLYLLDTGSKFVDKYSRVSQAADEIKKINRTFKVPCITATQFNRNVKPGKKKMSLEDIGLSDVIGWNADWVFGMYQDKDMKLDGRMDLIPLKTRESEDIENVELNWNFNKMDFSEVSDSDSIDTVKEFEIAEDKSLEDEIPF